MQRIFTCLVLIGVFISASVKPVVASQEQELIDEVRSAYQNMNSYASQVKVISDSIISGHPHKTTTLGSLKLLKPNFYNISWKQESEGSGMTHTNQGAIWNAGKGALLYTGYSYQQAVSDVMNIASATGISSLVAYTVPMIFFNFEGGNVLSMLKDVQLKGEESINGEDCFILEALNPRPMYSKETYWISKFRKVLVKLEEVLDDTKPMEIPEFTDDQIKESLAASGQEATSENIEAYKKMMDHAIKVTKESRMSGTITMIFEDIQVNPELDAANLEYSVPPGTVFKKDDIKELMKGLEEAEKIINSVPAE